MEEMVAMELLEYEDKMVSEAKMQLDIPIHEMGKMDKMEILAEVEVMEEMEAMQGT